MKIAIAQISTRAGDFTATNMRVEALSQSAVEQGAELLVLPMAAYTGPRPVDYSKREGFQIDLWAALLDLAQRVACPCMVPVVMQMDDEPYHEVVMLQGGEAVPIRLRAFLQSGEGPQRERIGAITTFEFGGVSMALAQTYEDLDDLVDANANVDVVLFISDYSYALDDAGSVLGSALAENRLRADAIALESLVKLLGDHLLLAGETLGSVIDRLYAGKEGLVHQDFILGLGQKGKHLFFDGLHLGRGVALGKVEEHALHFVQNGAGLLVSEDGIVESRGIRIVDDGLDVGLFLGDSGLEGGHIVGRLDFGKRSGSVRGIPLLQEDIGLGVTSNHSKAAKGIKQFFHWTGSLQKIDWPCSRANRFSKMVISRYSRTTETDGSSTRVNWAPPS